MITIKKLIDELHKFPLDAQCYAYEGEVIGLIIFKDNEGGVIYCSEFEKGDESNKTECFPVKCLTPTVDEQLKALKLDTTFDPGR